MQVHKTVIHILIGVVTTAWLVNFSAPFFIDTYKSDPTVNGAFMIIVGALFTADALGKLRRGNSSKPPQVNGKEGS